jgi:lipopolysaccharide/colanic/teichoic acid biosynthesis glycosyltransferase
MVWDVLRGKMSLVGPRPLSMEMTNQLIDEDPRYAYRLRVKAGLTGNARIYGRNTTEPKDLLKLDLIYIQHFSIMLDFKLLMSSIRSISKADTKIKEMRCGN